MRKSLFILLLILAAGCSKDPHSLDNVLPLDAYIFFDANVAKTKVNLVEDFLPSDKGTAFGVLGLKGNDDGVARVFDMYTSGENGNSRFSDVAKMYRADDEGAFIYDQLALWTTEEHSFYAFYQYDADCITEVNVDENGDPYISYTQPTTLDGMKDVLTASETGLTYTDSTLVALAFDHRLFALDVVVKNTGMDTINVSSAKITFNEVANNADLYFDGRVLISNSTSLQFDLGTHIIPGEVVENVTGEGGSGEDSSEYSLNGDVSFLFLPCSSLSVTVELSFTDMWGDNFSFKQTIPLTPTGENEEAGAFEAGKQYALVLTRSKSENGVTFIYDVLDWDEGDDIEHNFN